MSHEQSTTRREHQDSVTRSRCASCEISSESRGEGLSKNCDEVFVAQFPLAKAYLRPICDALLELARAALLRAYELDA